MSEASENTISVIVPRDPVLPKELDFDLLRKEGLGHIGKLAGKIWTDHNVHDPGITILEALIYALLDLGYRTNLPLEDLLTPKTVTEQDDNFFTPLRILTINPVTITDYRKLLLEVPGVRNAWLEPTGQEVAIFIDEQNNKLCCSTTDKIPPTDPVLTVSVLNEGHNPNLQETKECRLKPPYKEVHLNGLYKIYIEKDPDSIPDEGPTGGLVKRVKEVLNQHRNLCEDFADICTLVPVEVGVCAEIEVISGFDHDKVYTAVLSAVKAFIQPEITYYTLTQLLDKGKAIEDIFAGRPYRKDSFGFVDTEELEALERRSALYLSDLYNVILSIDGVRKINAIHFVSDAASGPATKVWDKELTLPKNGVPVFSMDKTCIDLYNAQGVVPLNKSRLHQGLIFLKKFRLPMDLLDGKVPLGNYRADLGDYYSIQNDFPVVYGIGEDGLPDNATLLRQTQALQLKGFLMFFDQMLANYTAQVAHIRNLFSLKRENTRTAIEKQTYFTSIPETVPDLRKLLKFYDPKTTPAQGTRLALPVANNDQWKKALEALNNRPRTQLTIGDCCNKEGGLVHAFTFSSADVRAIYINQLLDSFSNEKYTVSILRDRYGCFFVLYPLLPGDLVFVGTQRFKTAVLASNEARNVAFIATLKDSYSLITEASGTADPDMHCFDLSFRSVSYLNLVQEITENKKEYAKRRKQFLDHLLARFGDEFTDYALLQYQFMIRRQEAGPAEIDDQSYYVSEFDTLSRDRGKAFNYQIPSWNSDNVSGFEKRLSLLSGLNNYNRRNLCNFEVSPCFRLHLKNPEGITLFRGNRSYESLEEMHDAAEKLLKNLHNPANYSRLEKSLYGFEAKAIRRIFSTTADDENIVATSYIYNHALVDYQGQPVEESKKTSMTSVKMANDQRKVFIKKINARTTGPKGATKEFSLLPLAVENRYLNANAFQYEPKTHIAYTWEFDATVDGKKSVSGTAFSDEETAWDHMVKNADVSQYVTGHGEGYRWKLATRDGISFESVNLYPDPNRCLAAWRQAKMLGSNPSYLRHITDAGSEQLQLINEKGATVATSTALRPGADIDAITARSASLFSARNTKPEYPKESGKFGFRIPGKGIIPTLVSYSVYHSEKEALKEMGKVFAMGGQKKNYLSSGDPGNPEYSFILRDSKDAFLAIPTDLFETATDRDKALNAVLRSLKKGSAPAIVKEEPRSYSWIIRDGARALFTSDSNFPSQVKARSNFEKVLAKKASVAKGELFSPHIYSLKTIEKAVGFNFIYGFSDPHKNLDPVFMGPVSFATDEEAKAAYSQFVKKLPGLSLKPVKRAGTSYEFALFEENEKTPFAVQFVADGVRAPIEKARLVTAYVGSIYTPKGEPRESFVEEAMAENQETLYEWRFYKKNAPIARSPYCCPDKRRAAGIKEVICDRLPPINLKDCPPKDLVVCPDKDSKKFHFQVCFIDDLGNEFVLISYLGYESPRDAEDAWKEQWLEIIELTRNPEEYGGKGKVRLQELYKEPDSVACDKATFLVVIPDEKKKKFNSDQELIDYYVQLAHLFPIYRINDENDKACHAKYKYRAVDRYKKVVETKCELTSYQEEWGSLLWESVACFDTWELAIAGYQHFYALAGVPNNCRILCDKGCFYVGLVEVLVESNCEFQTAEEAWDDAFPENKDACRDCVPGGLREFLYAAEGSKNFIAVQEGAYWSFKVVSPFYYVADHQCHYNSQEERNAQMKYWTAVLEKLDWSVYITKQYIKNNESSDISRFLKPLSKVRSSRNTFVDTLCILVHGIRECLKNCPKNEIKKEELDAMLLACLRDKFQKDELILNLLERQDLAADELQHMANYFPVYKTEEGYCYRLYWPENDRIHSVDGLQPCGCEEERSEVPGCMEAYLFISSNCYSCCDEALIAFMEFCTLIRSGAYKLECTSKSECGPYSFRIVDENRILGYHPQQYSGLREVENAIKITRACADNTGVHLLEHILLRPKDEQKEECLEYVVIGDNRRIRKDCCLLPICPDYCCDLIFYPDMDKNDPCSDSNPESIYYLPGSDPYSFWATLVFPAWDRRFRSAEARRAFEKFLYKEVPALVGLHILWLSPRNLCKFEDAYKKWLEWIQDPMAPQCAPGDTTPNCALVQCIRQLQSEEPCPTVPGARGECDCEKITGDAPNPCCLPPETTDSIFWGYCPPEPGPKDPAGVILAENRSLVAGNSTSKPKTKAKGTSKTAKATIAALKMETSQKAADKSVLQRIRQRNPRYLANVESLAGDTIKATKSYERTEFFLQNAATIQAFVQLVHFFDRYSLQNVNTKDVYLALIKNAAWHLLDTLALEKKDKLTEEDLKVLTKSMDLLRKKGMSLKETGNQWKSVDLGHKGNSKVIAQIKKLLK